jgi:hypothetical protein
MSYLVTVFVEIKNGTSGDYENVSAAFETLGLKRPALGEACVAVFNDKALQGEIFLAVTRIDASDSEHSMAKTIEEPLNT